jgi:hypothetical protein
MDPNSFRYWCGSVGIELTIEQFDSYVSACNNMDRYRELRERNEVLMNDYRRVLDTSQPILLVNHDQGEILDRQILSEFTNQVSEITEPRPSESLTYESFIEAARLLGDTITPNVNIPVMQVVESQYVPEGEAYITRGPGIDSTIVIPAQSPLSANRSAVRGLQAQDMLFDDMAYARSFETYEAIIDTSRFSPSAVSGESEQPQVEKQMPPEQFSIAEFFVMSQ